MSDLPNPAHQCRRRNPGPRSQSGQDCTNGTSVFADAAFRYHTIARGTLFLRYAFTPTAGYFAFQKLLSPVESGGLGRDHRLQLETK
jgi:hypothetical protein